jgi:hypothetical protein
LLNPSAINGGKKACIGDFLCASSLFAFRGFLRVANFIALFGKLRTCEVVFEPTLVSGQLNISVWALQSYVQIQNCQESFRSKVVCRLGQFEDIKKESSGNFIFENSCSANDSHSLLNLVIERNAKTLLIPMCKYKVSHVGNV